MRAHRVCYAGIIECAANWHGMLSLNCDCECSTKLECCQRLAVCVQAFEDSLAAHSKEYSLKQGLLEDVRVSKEEEVEALRALEKSATKELYVQHMKLSLTDAHMVGMDPINCNIIIPAAHTRSHAVPTKSHHTGRPPRMPHAGVSCKRRWKRGRESCGCSRRKPACA